LGLQPVIFGTPDELDLKLRIQAMCPEVFLAHGKTIRHTAAQIAQCSVFVSNDSGLAHIASALDVPVVMACGATDARGIGPYPGHGRSVVSSVSCSPCFQVGRRPLRCTHEIRSACMNQITVEQMLGAAASCLRVPAVRTDHLDGLGLHESLTTENAPALAVSANTGAES
jgi:heptosyltransferase-2